jgi:hypothetical protein
MGENEAVLSRACECIRTCSQLPPGSRAARVAAFTSKILAIHLDLESNYVGGSFGLVVNGLTALHSPYSLYARHSNRPSLTP